MSSRLLWLLCLTACTRPSGPFTEPLLLGGQTISADQLNRGLEHYNYYCVTCHGENGDGRGIIAGTLPIPPRDLRLSMFKFAAASEGSLPADEDLIRIIQRGLDGTAMIPRDIPDAAATDIVQYIKTFAPEGEGWRNPKLEVARLQITPDPWGNTTAEAIDRGRQVYHGFADCWSCHPAYQNPADTNRDRGLFSRPPLTSTRERLWGPEVQMSAVYTRPAPNHPKCSSDTDCKGILPQLCRYGHCESHALIITPDFLRTEARAGSDRTSLYRVIAAGIPGTAMPRWKGSLDEKDLWALAYYVESLLAERGTAAALDRQAKLRAELEAPR